MTELELLQAISIVLSIASPIVMGVWVVARVSALVEALRRDVDRHEEELKLLRQRAHGSRYGSSA